MKRRVTVATAGFGLLLALTACGSEGGSEDVVTPAATTTTPAITSQAPAVDPNEPDAVALRGDWEIPAEDYVLHLIEDGTFLEDFQGIKDFRTGKYSVDGDTISLVGDDGNTDKGKISGDKLTFGLGVATRVQ